MASGSWLLDLLDRSWVDLTEDEKQVFDRWLHGARGYDLYILLRHAKRHRKMSKVEAFKAVAGILDDDEKKTPDGS